MACKKDHSKIQHIMETLPVIREVLEDTNVQLVHMNKVIKMV